MGRTLSFFTTGTAVMSSVKRVDVSNVRIPRSQRMTFVLPCIVMYSLAASHSSIVAAMPRLNSTALPESAVAALSLASAVEALAEEVGHAGAVADGFRCAGLPDACTILGGEIVSRLRGALGLDADEADSWVVGRGDLDVGVARTA